MALILTMLMVSYTYSVVGVFSCTSLPQLNWCSYYGIMPKLWPQGTYWLTVTLSVLVVLFPRFLKKALNSSVEVSPAQQAIAAAKKHAKELAVADRQRSLRRLRTSRLHLGTARLSSMGRRARGSMERKGVARGCLWAAAKSRDLRASCVSQTDGQGQQRQGQGRLYHAKG